MEEEYNGNTISELGERLSSRTEYELYIDQKFANILTRLKVLEDKVENVEKELGMNGEKELG